MRRFVVVLIAVTISACATTEQYVDVGNYKNLAPGNALIRVDRKNEFVGSGRSLKISDNGRVVGQLSPGNYLMWQRPAGEFQLQIVPAFLAASHPIPLETTARPGEELIFEIAWSWGKATFELRPMRRMQLPRIH